jgi:uncharacterized protein YaiE (UPF0345 family)
VNEYFDGKVKSLVVNSGAGKKTVGVMEPGEYEFNTQSKETMTVISGALSVFLPEYNEWEEFGTGSSFDVPANSKFTVKVGEETAYLCEFHSPSAATPSSPRG